MNQRLRLNQTNLNALQLYIKSTDNNAKIPIITYLNVSRNNLSKFCDNSLPDVEIIDITNNPIKNISYNNFTKATYLYLNQQRMIQ